MTEQETPLGDKRSNGQRHRDEMEDDGQEEEEGFNELLATVAEALSEAKREA